MVYLHIDHFTILCRFLDLVAFGIPVYCSRRGFLLYTSVCIKQGKRNTLAPQKRCTTLICAVSGCHLQMIAGCVEPLPFAEGDGLFFVLLLLPYLVIDRISNRFFKCFKLFFCKHSFLIVARNNCVAKLHLHFNLADRFWFVSSHNTIT